LKIRHCSLSIVNVQRKERKQWHEDDERIEDEYGGIGSTHRAGYTDAVDDTTHTAEDDVAMHGRCRERWHLSTGRVDIDDGETHLDDIGGTVVAIRQFSACSYRRLSRSVSVLSVTSAHR